MHSAAGMSARMLSRHCSTARQPFGQSSLYGQPLSTHTRSSQMADSSVIAVTLSMNSPRILPALGNNLSIVSARFLSSGGSFHPYPQLPQVLRSTSSDPSYLVPM